MLLRVPVVILSPIHLLQAKGILSGRLWLSASDAFSLLRHHARNGNRRLHDVARGVIDGNEELTLLVAGQLTSPRSGVKPESRPGLPPSPLIMPGTTDRQPSDTAQI